MSWISQNGLALYGAITGTAALLISFFGHRHSVKRDQIKLAVSFEVHPEQAENISRLRAESDQSKPWNELKLVEVCHVKVRNLGGIPAPLEDVGVIDENGEKHQALARSPHGGSLNFLRVLSELDEQIDPRSSRTFSIYLRKSEAGFTAISAYAVDQTGKTWRD